MPLKFLVSAFGKNGISLWNKAHGIDESPVVSYSEQKSISTECTFEEDTIDVKRLKSILIAMVEKVAFQLREQNKLASLRNGEDTLLEFRHGNKTDTHPLHIFGSRACCER